MLAEGPWELKPAARAILLIDVAGSLRVTRQLGDARAYHVLKFLSETVRRAGGEKGRVIRSLGDGFLLAFDSVDDALAHAITAQAEVARCNPTEVPIKIRCGIHFGDVIEADGDVFGVTVYLASRLTGHAHGGEILLTAEAKDACSTSETSFNDFGPTLLPGFEDPVRVYEYPWR
jgi:class 3 adenylate cyclase